MLLKIKEKFYNDAKKQEVNQRIKKLFIFLVFTYFIIKKIPVSFLRDKDVFKLLMLISIVYMTLDIIYPTVKMT